MMFDGRNDLTEFLFQGRNTAYGSYVLRAIYDRNMVFGVLVGSLIVGGIFVGPYLHQRWLRATDEAPLPVAYDRVINYSELSAPPPIEAVTPSTPVPELPQKQVKYVKPVVKPDEEVDEEELLPTMEEIRTSATGTTNIEGLGGDSIAYDVAVVDEPPPPPPPKAMKPFTVVEVMPTFPGGDEALIAFLAAELMYPTMAVEATISGTVYVQFTIGTDGRIQDVEAVRGIGGGCDEEAVRVVRRMPPWNPGVQGKQAVPVRMILPVKFTLK